MVVCGNKGAVTIALFPGLPTVQFLITCSMQKRGEGLVRFITWMTSVFYLGRQRGGGVLDLKNAFRACVLCFEPGAVRFSLCERSKLLSSFFRVLSIGDPPPSAYLHVGRHWCHSCDKMDQAFPLVFAYCKWSRTGRWEGLGTRLQLACILGQVYSPIGACTAASYAFNLACFLQACVPQGTFYFMVVSIIMGKYIM